MPDRSPEHDEQPPQWPPPQRHNEPTARPQAPYGDEANPSPSVTEPEFGGLPSPRSPQNFDGSGSAQHFGDGQASTYGGQHEPPQAFPSYDDTQPPPAPQFRAPAEEAPFHGFVPRQSPEAAPHEPPAAPEPASEPAPAAPLTHGRGVRMTIYGIGGAIAIGLIVAIVIMAGGSFVPDEEPADDQSEEQSQTGQQDVLLTAVGDVDPVKYGELADAAGTGEWVEWRYGRTASGDEEVPNAEAPDAAAADYGDDIEHLYQLGDGSAVTGQQNQQGQLGFVPAEPGVGVDHVTTAEVTDSTIGFSPRPGGRYSTDSPELELTQRSTAECLGDHDLGAVVAMNRSAGDGHSAHAVVAFSSGAIATTGISGAQGGTCTFLPDGHVPTAVAVTPGNEFALVSVWDTEQIKGLVAVIALADTPGTYAASWPDTYPGLPNPGHLGFAKLLGFVELDEIKAPTSIAVGTDHSGGNADRRGADLQDPAGREGFASDVATSGFAVVSSGPERLVEWIDLAPLLSGFAATYFEGDPGAYASPGGDPEAWPPTFENNGDLAPAAVGVTATDANPMVVAASGDVGYVGFRDGSLTVFDAEDPAAVGKGAIVDLPAAATCLTWSPDGKQLVATSRAARSVVWIDAMADEPEVLQTLQDSRIQDPICAQDTQTSAGGDATTVRAVVIADFGGHLHSFRHGDAWLTGGDTFNLDNNAFQYGGSYEPAGNPFLVSVTSDNVE